MGDWKMECPGCGSWTNSVGMALRDGQPCPHCGLPAAATAAVIAARERSADAALVERMLGAEKQLVIAEREAAAGRILARDLAGLLEQYEKNLTRERGDW